MFPTSLFPSVYRFFIFSWFFLPFSSISFQFFCFSVFQQLLFSHGFFFSTIIFAGCLIHVWWHRENSRGVVPKPRILCPRGGLCQCRSNRRYQKPSARYRRGALPRSAPVFCNCTFYYARGLLDICLLAALNPAGVPYGHYSQSCWRQEGS